MRKWPAAAAAAALNNLLLLLLLTPLIFQSNLNTKRRRRNTTSNSNSNSNSITARRHLKVKHITIRCMYPPPLPLLLRPKAPSNRSLSSRGGEISFEKSQGGPSTETEVLSYDSVDDKANGGRRFVDLPVKKMYSFSRNKYIYLQRKHFYDGKGGPPVETWSITIQANYPSGRNFKFEVNRKEIPGFLQAWEDFSLTLPPPPPPPPSNHGGGGGGGYVKRAKFY